MNQKFKVGDKVRAIDYTRYVITNAATGWEGIVTEVCGDYFSAKTTKCSDKFIEPGEKFYCLQSKFFKKIKIEDGMPVIVEHLIRGNKTIIKLSNGKVGIAKCSPEDKFNVATGAAIATARAYGEVPEIEENPKDPGPIFKVGQLVQIKEWDEMAKEYGVARSGWIDRPICFNPEMECLCGEFAEITKIIGDEVELRFFNVCKQPHWTFCTYMIKPVKGKDGGAK